MNYHRVWIRPNGFKGTIQDGQIQRSFVVSCSVCVCFCVCVFPCFCPSLHVSTKQLEAWPCRPHRSPAYESMGTLRGEKTGSCSTRTWLSYLQHTHRQTHTCIHSLVVRGFTSPWPKQRSMLNFDPSHYLARRWGLGWGDNLWTLTFNPGPAQCKERRVVLHRCVSGKWETQKERESTGNSGSGGITYFGSCNEGMSEKLNSPISSYLEKKKAANSAKVLHCFPFMLSNLSPRCIGMLSGQCFYTTSFSLWPFLILYFFFFFCSLGLRLCLVDEWPDIRCVELEILWKYMESKQ